MSDLRRSKKKAFCGELAAIDFGETQGQKIRPFKLELLAGARSRATQLQLKLTEFFVGRGGMSLGRLDSVLTSRNIQGVLVLPSHETPDWSHLNWRRYTGIYAGCNVGDPLLHCTYCDPFQSIKLMLARLAKRGYRRPGLFLAKRRDDCSEGRWTAGYHIFQQLFAINAEPVPCLILPEAREAEFVKWFKRYQPDLVVGHDTEAVEWMEKCGARVPETHGFASLNLTVKTRPCAGLDHRPQDVGARCIDLLAEQLLRNERGIPDSPITITVLARWVEGPTVRPAAIAGDPGPTLCSTPQRFQPSNSESPPLR
ncbi:MAG: LacI family transcriptional regulator [Nibricoccus sp.]